VARFDRQPASVLEIAFPTLPSAVCLMIEVSLIPCVLGQLGFETLDPAFGQNSRVSLNDCQPRQTPSPVEVTRQCDDRFYGGAWHIRTFR